MSTKFTRFDKRAAGQLRQELNDHLAAFEREHGVKIDLGNAKFDEGRVRFIGVEVKIPEVDGKKQGRMLHTYLSVHGIIASSDPREVFESSEYVLVDYRPRAPKRPWVARSKADGKSYLLTDVSAKVHFSAK